MEVPYEYFCKTCKQLRLCLDPDLTVCGNCKSDDIITGEINELDIEGRGRVSIELIGELYAL